MTELNIHDIREILFNYHLGLAKEGYKEDATDALKILASYVEEAPNIPITVKDNLKNGVAKLIKEKAKDNTPHAFYLKREGSKPPKKRELISRDIDWAKQVYEVRYYEYKDGIYYRRKRPLAKDVAAQEVAFTIDSDAKKFKTILNAYRRYEKALCDNDN